MAKRRRGSAPRSPAPGPTGSPPRPGPAPTRRPVDVGEWPGPRDLSQTRRSLTPTLLWGAAALLTAIPLIAVIGLATSGGRLPGTRWTLIGVILLFAVIILAFGLKAAQAFLNWKDPD